MSHDINTRIKKDTRRSNERYDSDGDGDIDSSDNISNDQSIKLQDQLRNDNRVDYDDYAL